MRVLLTGHLGYLGTVMVAELEASGFSVVGVDTGYFTHCVIGPVPNVTSALHKDIRDLTVQDLSGFDAVVHYAALSNDPLGDLDQDWTYDINHRATVRLARLAKEAGVTRFVYASSCSMYGRSGDGLLSEEAQLHPLTPYATSKVRSEEDLSLLADGSFSPIYMRNATAYGFSPRLRADVVLNNLVCHALASGKILILSDGTPWRPIVHAEDIAQACVALLTAPRAIVHDQAYNIGANSENYRVSDLAAIVRDVVPGSVIEYGSGGGPDPRSYRVDFSKFSQAFPHFTPKWTARSGALDLSQKLMRYADSAGELVGSKFIRIAQLKRLLDQGGLDATLRWRASVRA